LLLVGVVVVAVEAGKQRGSSSRTCRC
jgi:hypothetical protein